jgi:hypothetical protein
MTYASFESTSTYLRDDYTRTQRPPLTVDGVVFLSYRRPGVGRYVLISEDGKATVSSNYSAATYSARAHGVTLGTLFRSEKSALQRAARALARGAANTRSA